MVSEKQKQVKDIEELLKEICKEHTEFLQEIHDLNQHLDMCLVRIRAHQLATSLWKKLKIGY